MERRATRPAASPARAAAGGAWTRSVGHAAARRGTLSARTQPPQGPLRTRPPTGGAFSLEGREAPGLYVVAWLLSVGGAALIMVAALASDPGWRPILALGGWSVLGLGLATAAGYQIVARADRPAERYHGPSPLLVFGVVVASSTVVSGVLVWTGALDPEEPFGFLATLLVVALGYVLGVWLFAVRSDALAPEAMGWPPRDAGASQPIRDALVGAAVMVPATWVVLLASSAIAALLDVQPPEVLPAVSSSAEAVAVAVAAAVVAPIGEEVFFRGFSLTAWLRDLGPRAALGRSSLFFATVHIAGITPTTFGEGAKQALLQTLVILPVGLILGLLFLRRGLAASIGAHMTYNGLLLALAWAVTGTPAMSMAAK